MGAGAARAARAARAAAIALGTLVAIEIVYTCITDGSPFRIELLTPWMKATLVDFYALIILISAWVVYKEESWLRSILWIILLICYGSVAANLYVAIQLFKISSDEPAYMILFRDSHARLLTRSGDFLIARKPVNAN